MKFDSNALTIDRRNAMGEKYLGSWRHLRDGDFAPLWKAANDARGAAADFYMHAQTVTGDANLSDHGKSSKLTEHAKASLRGIGKAQQLLNDAVAEIKAERAKLTAAERKTGTDGLAQTILDLEYARLVREMPQAQRDQIARQLLAGEHPQIVEAVLRLPAMATGLTENMVSMIEKAAINRTHPEAVMRHEQLEAAIQTAQSVIRQSAAVLGEGAPPLDMSEQIQALGGNWRGILQGPEGAMDAIAARVAPTEA